jgi:hypothetical protein
MVPRIASNHWKPGSLMMGGLDLDVPHPHRWMEVHEARTCSIEETIGGERLMMHNKAVNER